MEIWASDPPMMEQVALAYPLAVNNYKTGQNIKTAVN